jgi:hypothetical protein
LRERQLSEEMARKSHIRKDMESGKTNGWELIRIDQHRANSLQVK